MQLKYNSYKDIKLKDYIAFINYFTDADAETLEWAHIALFAGIKLSEVKQMKVNDYIRLKAQLSKIYDELDNLQPVNFVMYNNIQYNFNLHLENVGVAQYSALESAEYNYRNDFWELLPNIVAHLMYTNDLIINDEIFFDGNRVDEFYDVVMDLSVAEIFAVHKAYALKNIAYAFRYIYSSIAGDGDDEDGADEDSAGKELRDKLKLMFEDDLDEFHPFFRIIQEFSASPKEFETNLSLNIMVFLTYVNYELRCREIDRIKQQARSIK